MYHLTFFLFVGFLTTINGQCIQPNATVINSPPFLGLDKSGFDVNNNLQLTFEWDPAVYSRVVTDVHLNSLDGSQNCSYYGIISNWTSFLDSTLSCNAGVQATYNWTNLYYSCQNSFITTVLPTIQSIQFSMTISYQENVTTPTGSILRNVVNVVPVEIDLPTTATFTFGSPLTIVDKEVGAIVIMKLPGDRTNFDSIGFIQSLASYLNISSWRIILQGTVKRDFSVQFIIQPGPDGESTSYQASSALQQGINSGAFTNQTGIQVTSIQEQNYDIQAVILGYTTINTTAVSIQLRTFVSDFPSPAGVQSQNITFSGNANAISVVQISNTTSGNFYVQDWNIVIVPTKNQCELQGLISINYNFTGANPTTVSTVQFSTDSSSVCPTVVHPAGLTGTLEAYTDISLTTKIQTFRQTDTIYFQAKVTNNELPIKDDGLTITSIQFRSGNDALKTLVMDEQTNYTGLNYGDMSTDGNVIAWMVIDPNVFPVTNQFSVYSFVFSLAIAYQSNKRDAPSHVATVANNLIFESNIASSSTPSTTSVSSSSATTFSSSQTNHIEVPSPHSNDAVTLPIFTSILILSLFYLC